MTQDELIELLRAHEWRDVEFKEARRAVPRDAYETVSAFANTEGGHLVFGVRKHGREMEIVGVLDVDKVQNEFLSTLRQSEKISTVLGVEESLHKQNDSDLLVFYVPEVHRSQKPVFLNGNIGRAFVRSGGCDVRCSDEERNRFLIDAAAERPDGQAVDLDLRTAFDPDSIKWYRAIYEARPGNRSYASLSDTDFLAEMGLLVERGGERHPTRAAILLFGANPTFRQLLPHPVVDCQRFTATREAADTGGRWFDRLVLEENLIRTWRSLIEDWYEKFAEHPFRLDPATMRRDDTPPDYQAFRESMINLIMHQDYSDHSRKAVIRHYADQTIFWNPGDAFAADADLLEPGEREVRNPRIVLAFRRIGLSEHAGWGLRDVFRNWQQLGNVPPRIMNDRRRKSFELVLKKEALLSEHQLLLQAQLGVRLTDAQARTFAFACHQHDVTLSEIKAMTGLPGPEAAGVADQLVKQVLLERIGAQRYVVAGHLRERLARANRGGDPVGASADLVTDRDNATAAELSTAGGGRTPSVPSGDSAEFLTALSAPQWRIVELCDVPRRPTNVMVAIGETDRGRFKRHHVDPLLNAGILGMTNPDKPSAANQRYVLTEAGAALKAARLGKQKDERRGQPQSDT